MLMMVRYDDIWTEKIGLRREEGHPIMDSRVMDGFNVRFAGDKMIVNVSERRF
jgi:hypothetical protein